MGEKARMARRERDNRIQGRKVFELIGLTPLALTIVVVISFALLAVLATRNGGQIISAFLAVGIWLFFAFSVLVWLRRRGNPLLSQELGKRRLAEPATQKDEAAK